MTWRAMDSLLVLRGEVDLIAPDRSTASDGLVGDEEHQTRQSDHNPHYVAGVGAEIVTALDLTHDPARGFDSYTFAEALRRNRDRRIKYVISNHRIFSSYASGTRPAWTWGAYNGVDPHENHVHVSVLDAVISDTSTPWNLEGLEIDMTPAQQYVLHVMNYRIDAIVHLRPAVVVPPSVASDGTKFAGFTEPCQIGLWTAAQTASDAELEDLVRRTLQVASDDPAVAVTLTPEQIAAMSAAVVNGVTTAIEVPTADEIAEEITDREVEAAKAAAAALEAAE